MTPYQRCHGIRMSYFCHAVRWLSFGLHRPQTLRTPLTISAPPMTVLANERRLGEEKYDASPKLSIPPKFFLPPLTYKYPPQTLFSIFSAHNHYKVICLRHSSVSMASAVLAESSSAMRRYPAIAFSEPQAGRATADVFDTSVEHGAVKVVAVNDPFIEPHYAVSSLQATLLSWSRRAPE